MFCTNCGTKVFEGASFCQKCGTMLKKREPEIKPEPLSSPFPETTPDASISSENITPLAGITDETPEGFSASPDRAQEVPENAPAPEKDTGYIYADAESYSYTPEIQEERSYSFADSVKAAHEKAENETNNIIGGNNTDNIISINAGDGKKNKKVKKEEKIYFGKTAFFFCLIIIGVLSVACGVLAGLYINTLA